jgi:hypothetical protein
MRVPAIRALGGGRLGLLDVQMNMCVKTLKCLTY